MKHILFAVFLIFTPFVSYADTDYYRTPSGSDTYESVEAGVTLVAGDVDWIADYSYSELCFFDDTHLGDAIYNEQLWIDDAFCVDTLSTTTGSLSGTLKAGDLNDTILGVSVISYDIYGDWEWTVDMEWIYLGGNNYGVIFTMEEIDIFQGLTLVNNTDDTAFIGNTSQTASTVFLGFSPLVAGVMGIILALGMGALYLEWLSEKTFQKTMKKAEKISKESKRLLDKT